MNVFSFTGNLGRDCRTGNAGGTAVCNFAVAVKSGYGQNEQTVWVDCALWGRQAESRLPEFLVKGQQVAISGELGTREYDKDGQTKTAITCRVSSISLVGKRDDNQGQQHGGYQQQQAPQKQHQQSQQRQQSQQQGTPMDFDDDIPFAPIGLQHPAILMAC